VDVAQLADGANHPEGMFAPGFRWSELRALELEYFNPTDSALAVPLFPLALLRAWLNTQGVEVESADGAVSASADAQPVLWDSQRPLPAPCSRRGRAGVR
jgi:hypothetical protein